MSVSLWRWTPACDGIACPGDCDLCSYEGEDDGEIQRDIHDTQER